MYSFLICIVALVLGYLLYGGFVERVFKPDPSRTTPAYEINDKVDYLPMPTWKVFMIQLLNIAGTGPIFGAIMGAKFGPACYLWVVFGSILAGAMHDYFSGMLSLRNKGMSLPDIIGKYLGGGTKKVMLVFSVLLLLLVGAVFVYSPALILGDIAGDGGTRSVMLWILVIFVYYIIATLLPVDKIIGRIYPLFAFALLFMAISLLVCLLVKWPDLPEIWDGLGNLGAQKGLAGMDSQPILPCLFITVACGAISGFHATQSPMMARCLKNEKLGRPVFYGAMITEGIIALVWAAVGSYFFFDGGAEAVGSRIGAAAPEVVTSVSRTWLGVLGGVMALLGVVAAPITSGDTALRSARLIISDALHVSQDKRRNRLLVSLPIFVVTALVLWFNIADENGFNMVWRYFGWSNQTLACFTLWAIAVFLSRERKDPLYLIALLPACFMTGICLSYIATNKVGFNLPAAWGIWIAAGIFFLCLVLFCLWKTRRCQKNL